MNRKGSYRCIPRCTQISSIEKSGKHKIGSSWRRKFSKKNGRYVKKAFSGKPTYFICAGKPSDIYYNLCRVMDDFLERNNQRYVEFKCFFGSFLTDITSYDHLYHKYGKAKVEVYGKQMNLSTMIKSRMLHRRSLHFTLDKSTVLKKGSATDLTAAKNLNGMSLREGLRLTIVYKSKQYKKQTRQGTKRKKPERIIGQQVWYICAGYLQNFSTLVC